MGFSKSHSGTRETGGIRRKSSSGALNMQHGALYLSSILMLISLQAGTKADLVYDENELDYDDVAPLQYYLQSEESPDVEKRAWNNAFAGGMGKRAWNSAFNGGMGKRAWNNAFAGGMGKRAWNNAFAGGMGKRGWNSAFSGGMGKRS